MFDGYGFNIVGHGVINPIELTTLESQLDKYKTDPINYRKKIEGEFKAEQGSFYRIMYDIVEQFAIEYARKTEVEDTEAFNECVNYWTQRAMFLILLQYKIISLGIESQKMKEDISL